MKNPFTTTWGASPLRNRFILFFVALASVPTLILGGLTLYLLDVSHRYDVSTLELQLIEQKREEIDKFFLDTLGILELQVGFTQTSEIELSQQEFLLDGILEANPAIDSVRFIGLDGRETSKRSRDTANTDRRENLAELPKFLVPKTGTNYIGPVYHTLSGPFITLSAPVKNRNGDMIQLLSAEVSLRSVTDSLKKTRLGETGYLILLDQNGEVIASGVEDALPPATNLALLDRVARARNGETLNGLDSRDRYASVAAQTPVAGAAKRITDGGWVLLVEWPLAEADAVLNGVRNRVTGVAVASILAVLFLAPYFAYRLVKPIKTLESGAAQIEKGDFEKRVEIRTHDELEELGEAFNRMAQGLKQLQELRNEFVFIAAHELRTPVTAIKGYLSMVREGSAGKISDTLKKYLEPVWLSNERLVKLVNDILEIARSEAGKTKVEVAPTDVRQAVRAIVMEIKPIADEKSVSVVYDEPASLPIAIADDGRLKEVIMNFVSNAVKYNKPGGRVRIYHALEGANIITHVEDNGFGMSEEEQKHMFEKFFRAESGETKAIQGTGLGLFITKELVEKMGGEVWFISRKGVGTRFSFSLRAQ